MEARNQGAQEVELIDGAIATAEIVVNGNPGIPGVSNSEAAKDEGPLPNPRAS
jgi:hypothetical protein